MAKKNGTSDKGSVLAAYEDFLSEFIKETDRAAVVLGAAKIDLLLYQILQKHFVPVPGSKDELLDGDSPLSTFSAKINMMYRLGLLTAEYTKSFHVIRRIRNDFAHEVAGCNLNSGAHRDRVKELVSPYEKAYWFRGLRNHTAKWNGELSGAALDFRVMLGMIVGELESIHSRCTPLRAENAHPLLDGAFDEPKEMGSDSKK